ncbi:MAG: cation diffusion facilitator family transporter [Muribaculaceae bacterium]|nr:cation diffusion facilitator family transporter [Muribaculaceae bacterium]
MKLHHSHDENLSNLLSVSSFQESKAIRHIVILGCIVNALLMGLKLGVGYWGHSDALVADGFHSLNDFAADLLMLLFIGISFRQPDSRYSYGYGKYETFSTVLISIFLFFVCWHITHEAIESIKDYLSGEVLPQPDIWTVVVVVFSMCGKEFLYRFYRNGSRKTGITALFTNAWHHRSDALASVATLIGVSFSHFFGRSWRILDPCASLVLVIFIFYASLRMFIPAFLELMDRSLPNDMQQKASEVIASTKGVKALIELKSRRNGHFIVFDIVIAVEKKISVEEAQMIVGQVQDNLKKVFGDHIMIGVTTFPYSGYPESK